MNKRTEKLRDRIIGEKPWICPERARNLTNSWKETEGQNIHIRRALAFAEVLNKQSVYINEDELIVGNQGSGFLATPIFPEYGVHWLESEIDNLEERRLDSYRISVKTKEELKEIFKYWKGKTHFDRVKSDSLKILPNDFLPAWDPDNGNLNDVVSNSGRMATGNGHVIANFERCIKTGLRGVIQEARDGIRKCDDSLLTDPEAAEKKLFLQSVVITMEAAVNFAKRHGELAVQLAAVEDNPQRKRECEQIAEICNKVPENPASNFREAIQSYWLMHLMLQIEANGHSMSFGRFDQILNPYYEIDLEAGLITREDALELVECFLIKCNEIKKIRQWSHTRKMHGYPLFQTLTIGGITANGADAVNDFTYITLDATGNVKLQEPTTIARIHPKNPQDFVFACSRTIVKHGGGLPGLFNDEVAIQMLMMNGVSLPDARNWSVDGCSEPIVPGKHNTITSGTCHINLLKVLELALRDGLNKRNGKTLFKGEGGLPSFQSYEQLEEAYKKQLQFYISVTPILDNITSRAHKELTPCPYLSGLLDYRIEIGKDVEEGHGPNYNNTLMIGHCSVNVGNALYAVKRAVFEDKKCTAEELAQVLDNNFEGERGLEIQQLLRDYPKYGNDHDGVDFTVRDSLNFYLKEYEKYTPYRGGQYCPSPQTLSANAFTGTAVDATPDGRRAGEVTADNSSPDAGHDIEGVTAVLKSVAKLDHVYASHGSILNVKLHPSAVANENGLSKFVSLIRGFFDLQGFQIQINVVSAKTLKDAQKNPDKYQNLVVKVAGYSALFTSLDEHVQNQLIARTEHGC